VAVTIRRLEEADEMDGFDCGDAPLNAYLQRHAWINQQKISIGVTYVAVEDAAPRSVLGYFTLAAASAPRDRFPARLVRGLPAYDLPLLLLARLAVDRRFVARGLGHALISEAFRIALRVAGEAGGRGLVTDAYADKAGWYARYGFIELDEAATSATRKMFLDMRTLRRASEPA